MLNARLHMLNPQPHEVVDFCCSSAVNRVEEKRNILIRVIVPETEETRDKIIRATNSQTAIPKSSLRATDSIHRQIEDYLKPRGLYRTITASCSSLTALF